MVVATLRELWRRRRVVIVGMVIAVTGAVLMSYSVSLGILPKLESRQYDAGLATAEVLVDSPSSQVVDVGGGGSTDGSVEPTTIDIGGLSTRARLLASLMASNPLKDNVAKAAGIRPDKLIVIAPTGDDLTPRAAPATNATVKPGDRDANVINLYVDETLPIITMRVESPDARSAGRLATSAVSQLGKYLKSVASAGSIPDARQLVVSSLGPPTSATVVRGPGQLFGILVGLVILGIWCLGVIMIPRLINTWTVAARLEAAEADFEGNSPGTHELMLAPLPDRPRAGAPGG